MAEAWIETLRPVIDDAGALNQLARLVPFEAKTGASLFSPGDEAQGFVFVLSGSVKVLVRAENGREIVLYRVAPGQTCVLTTICLIGGQRYAAEGVAESACRVVVLPRQLFDSLMD